MSASHAAGTTSIAVPGSARAKNRRTANGTEAPASLTTSQAASPGRTPAISPFPVGRERAATERTGTASSAAVSPAFPARAATRMRIAWRSATVHRRPASSAPSARNPAIPPAFRRRSRFSKPTASGNNCEDEHGRGSRLPPLLPRQQLRDCVRRRTLHRPGNSLMVTILDSSGYHGAHWDWAGMANR